MKAPHEGSSPIMQYPLDRLERDNHTMKGNVQLQNPQEVGEDPSAASLKSSSGIYLHGWALGMIITSLTLGIFLIALDTTIIGVAVPKITSDFQNLNDIAWFGSAYLLTVTAFQPSFGTLYKFFNAKLVYIGSVVIFEGILHGQSVTNLAILTLKYSVGSIICAAAPSSTVFIIGRAISGLGAAGIYQGALGIISYTVVLEQRPLYFGVVVSSFAISACIGPVIGGALTDRATWRWCFWMYD